MAITYVQGTFSVPTVGTTQLTCTVAPVLVGDLCIVTFIYNSSAAPIVSLTDDKSNAYTIVETATAFGVNFVQAYLLNATNGPSIARLTLTNATSGTCFAQFDEFSGVAKTAAIDGQNINSQTGVSGANATVSGNITTTQPGDLIYCLSCNTSGAFPTGPGAGFTITLGGSTMSEYLIQGSAGTIQGTWTFGSAANTITSVLAFKGQSAQVSKLNAYGILLTQGVQVSKLNAYAVLGPRPPVDLAGNLAPSVAIAADLTIIPGVVNYVDFAGNIGGVSLYGNLFYGQNLYSRDPAFAPVFAGDIGIVGQDFFDGDLSPVVTFAGALDLLKDLSGGDLAPQVTFAADLSLTIGFAGDLPVQVTLGATLTGLVSFDGDLPITVSLAGSTLTAGPLWAASAPCPSAPWTPTEPCPPSLWTPADPCDPVEWERSELCNG